MPSFHVRVACRPAVAGPLVHRSCSELHASMISMGSPASKSMTMLSPFSALTKRSVPSRQTQMSTSVKLSRQTAVSSSVTYPISQPIKVLSVGRTKTSEGAQKTKTGGLDTLQPTVDRRQSQLLCSVHRWRSPQTTTALRTPHA